MQSVDKHLGQSDLKSQDGDTISDSDFDAAGNLTLDADNKRFVYDAENDRRSSSVRPIRRKLLMQRIIMNVEGAQS